MPASFSMPLKRDHKIFLFVLLALGVVCQSLTMVRSGLLYKFGLGFWGASGHDGIWHLALANQVLRGFPPPHPTLAGAQLTNYHYFFDFILALLNKITGVSLVNLYFQFFPIVFSGALGILSFLVGYYGRKDFWTGFWFAFLNYFAGSFGFIVTLVRTGQIGGESIFWSMQSISTLINPPLAFSLVVLLSGMLALLRIKKWNFAKIFSVALLFGILINIKAYAGVVGLAALVVYSLRQLLEGKKVYLVITALAVFIATLLFIPVNRHASSLFLFSPFWFVHSMIESYDRLYLPRWALARYFLMAHGIGPRLVAIEALSLAAFLVGNLGTRAIGSWDLLKRVRHLELFDWFLFTGAAVGLLIPLFFIQRGTTWNTIQFFYYFLFFANFYAAGTLSRIMKTKSLPFKLIVIILFVSLTIPTTVATLKDCLGWPPPTALLSSEAKALESLKKMKDATVLTYPYDRFSKNKYKTTPLPLKDSESTAYVSAFSGKQTFLEDTVNLNISAYDWAQREKDVKRFFGEGDKFFSRGFLINNKIGYIYLTGKQQLPHSELDLGVEAFYDDGETKIYRVHGII